MGRLSNYIPALRYGHKIYPEDMAGVVGRPHVGETLYVDADNGSDSAGGRTWEDAFQTLEKAEENVTSDKYDTVIVAPEGTSGTAETATVTWDKNHAAVIGASAPVGISQRARIVTTTDSVDPCHTISGAGNTFANLQFATFQASNDVLVNLTGSRNYFSNVHFAGIGHATAGDDSTARCLVIDGGQENFFENCTFGLDTVMRSTTNATLEFANSASRNVFINCRFIMAADNVGPNHVLFTGTSSIDRWVQFHDCTWYAFWTNDSDKITHVIDMEAQTATGHVLLTGHQTVIGADDWEATNSGNLYLEPHTATNTAIGLAINPSVS